MSNYNYEKYLTDNLNEKGEKLKDDEVSPAMKELIEDRKKQTEREAELKKKFGY